MRALLYITAVLLLTSFAMTERPSINLTYTSLAKVSGSPVNGPRDVDNPYYGVPNLFDNGTHVLNGINYNYWLGDKAKPYDWVAVHFTVPVTVREVQVEAPASSELPQTGSDMKTNKMAPLLVLLYRGNKVVEELTVTIPRTRTNQSSVIKEQAVCTGVTTLKEPLTGITRAEMRISQPFTRLDEWRIMGTVPVGTTYTVCPPHVTRSEGGSREYASIAFANWATGLFKDAKPLIIATPSQFIITYQQGDLNLFRFTADRVTGKVTGEALVELTPIPPAAVKDKN